MSARAQLVEIREILTPADHQTHRRYPFLVRLDSHQITIWVRYAPKRLGTNASSALAEAALAQQAASLASRVGESLVAEWAADYRPVARRARVSNLLTISLDDADGAYRGAGHRQSDDQHLEIGPRFASPGLVVGPLPAGPWTLTVSAHTLVSDQCELSIQIAAEIASSR